MSDPVLMEEPLQFGDGGRLFGILTLPSRSHRKAPGLPVFVFLNAGLLHRVGPHRLYVLLARDLSRMGFSSLGVAAPWTRRLSSPYRKKQGYGLAAVPCGPDPSEQTDDYTLFGRRGS